MNKKMVQTPERFFPHPATSNKKKPMETRHPPKPITDHTLTSSVACTSSLVIALSICIATIGTALIPSVLKSLINLFFSSPTILNHSSPRKQKSMSSSAPPELPAVDHSFSAPRNTSLPESSKKTLFLGLCRTLVRFTFDPPCDQFDFVVYPLIKGNKTACYVLMRPGLNEFLRAAKSASFEIVIYTRLPSEYACPIIDMLDPIGEFITHRLYQNSCIDKYGMGVFVKDLVTTGRKLDRSVIIDNNPRKHVKQWTNAIAVRPFLGVPTDTELIKLLTFFEVSSKFSDLRQLINITLITPSISTLPLPSTDKKTLFLDLDHTLIYASAMQPSGSNYLVNEPYFIIKRPGVELLFRTTCRASFEIVIFTAASAGYASPILDWLDPDHKDITHRLYRNACTRTDDGFYEKDLTTTGRKLESSVIIDDSPTLVSPQENALFVQPFKGDSSDVELWKLLLFFDKHSRFDDMRIAARYINRVLYGFSNGRRRWVNCLF